MNSDQRISDLESENAKLRNQISSLDARLHAVENGGLFADVGKTMDQKFEENQVKINSRFESLKMNQSRLEKAAIGFEIAEKKLLAPEQVGRKKVVIIKRRRPVVKPRDCIVNQGRDSRKRRVE